MVIFDFNVAVMLLAGLISLYGFPRLFCPNNKEGVLLGIGKGMLFHLSAVLIFSLFYYPGDYFFIIIIAFGSSLLRGWKNFLKNWLAEKNKGAGWLVLVYVMPLLVPFILALLDWLTPYYFLIPRRYLNRLIDPEIVSNMLLILAGLYFLTIGGSEIVKATLSFFRHGIEVKEEPEATPAGWIIGILERLLFVILIISGNMGSIGFVLAFKSLARFEDLKKQTFAEYYLVGTMISALLAILTGLLLRFILICNY